MLFIQVVLGLGLVIFFQVMKHDVMDSAKSQYRATNDPIFIIGGIISWAVLIYIAWNLRYH